MKLSTKKQAEKYLNKFIPSANKEKFPGVAGLRRATEVNNALNNPQNSYQVIHIAGTSGKGTTAFLASNLLTQHGKKVGLHLSPHILDIRERFLINNLPLPDKKWLNYLNQILPKIEKLNPTYFELLTSLAFYIFEQEKVDVAVIETGLGGTYDATNTITQRNKIAVITRLGKDHTNILGKTIKEIAAQKAGIIKNNNTVITINQKGSGTISEIAESKNANLKLIDLKTIKVKNITSKGTDFTIPSFEKPLHTNLIGKHQVENIALALEASSTVIPLETKKVKEALTSVNFLGRLDVEKAKEKELIIDGAHNPQKISALVNTVKKIHPNTKFTTILAVKKGKDAKKIITLLKPLTNTLIATSYFKNTQDLKHIAYEANTLEKIAKDLQIHTKRAESPVVALKLALDLKNPILITGSLYYLKDIYDYLHSQQGSL